MTRSRVQFGQSVILAILDQIVVVLSISRWSSGCVANFAQEVMKGQLSRLVGGLRGQGVEQFGRSEAFVSGPDSQLFLLDHMHEFDPNECVLGCLERFEP